MFMGTEIAQEREWNVESSVDWHLAELPERKAFGEFIRHVGEVYRNIPMFWRTDPNPESFEWIDFNDRENTVISYLRREGSDCVMVVFNFTPVPRENYRIGAPEPGPWECIINTDDARFGGGAWRNIEQYQTEDVWSHGRAQSLILHLPPLGALVLIPARLRELLLPASTPGEKAD
jgi:1,4-alpha-glucan branching enzyme